MIRFIPRSQDLFSKKVLGAFIIPCMMVVAFNILLGVRWVLDGVTVLKAITAPKEFIEVIVVSLVHMVSVGFHVLHGFNMMETVVRETMVW